MHGDARLAFVRSSLRQYDFVPLLKLFLTQHLDHAAYSTLMGDMYILLTRQDTRGSKLADDLVDAALHARALLQIQSRVLTFVQIILECDGPIIEALAWAQRNAFARASRLMNRAFRWLHDLGTRACIKRYLFIEYRLAELGLHIPYPFTLETMFNTIIFT